MLQFIADRRGVSAIEYALLAGVIALALTQVLKVPADDLAQMLAQVALGAGGSGASH